MNDIEFKLLASQKDEIPVVANWLHSEWGHLVKESSVKRFISGISSKVSQHYISVHIIALKSNILLGLVALKTFEMSQHPEKEFWLGILYVDKTYRHKGTATKLINYPVAKAKEHSINKFHLQTENLTGGIYKKSGWKPIEIVKDKVDDVLVMEMGL